MPHHYSLDIKCLHYRQHSENTPKSIYFHRPTSFCLLANTIKTLQSTQQSTTIAKTAVSVTRNYISLKLRNEYKLCLAYDECNVSIDTKGLHMLFYRRYQLKTFVV